MIRWVAIALLALAAPALAGQQKVHIEWGYTPPSAPAVTGFQLYQEGVRSCLWPGAETTAGDCTVELSKRSTTYTLTATFADGTESPHSAPFVFTLPEPPPPVLLKIDIGG